MVFNVINYLLFMKIFCNVVVLIFRRFSLYQRYLPSVCDIQCNFPHQFICFVTVDIYLFKLFSSLLHVFQLYLGSFFPCSDFEVINLFFLQSLYDRSHPWSGSFLLFSLLALSFTPSSLLPLSKQILYLPQLYGQGKLFSRQFDRKEKLTSTEQTAGKCLRN